MARLASGGWRPEAFLDEALAAIVVTAWVPIGGLPGSG
jgi:hypothetical protein